MNKKPRLYIFSGLPGVGKTTLAEKLAKYTNAVFLRIDTIEQALRDLCSFNVQGEAYRLSYRIAKDNLMAGNDVIADSCNPIQLTRDEWEDTALSSKASYLNIEIICSDKNVHKQRVESRVSTVRNLKLPSWQQVINREYHEWEEKRVILDTALRSIDDSFSELITYANN